MVMPFQDPVADDVYRHSTKPIIESCGLKMFRADEIFSANPVFDDIIAAIEQSAIVIVDISGKNPNCFYELGIAHTMKRARTIMITHDEHKASPFDIAHFRIIQYKNSIAGKTTYEEALRKTVASVLSGIPEIYADEFEFVLSLLKGTQQEHAIWIIQAIALASRPLHANENTHVEGARHGSSHGATECGKLLTYITPFLETGYVAVLGESLALSDKGRAFADYVTAIGFAVFALNDQVFIPNYKPFDERYKGYTVANEE